MQASKHFTWILVSIALVVTAPTAARAQACAPAKPARVALILGAYTGANVAAVATRHDTWWETPRQSFHVVWDESASKGQDRLIHSAISYHTSQLAAILWDWACVPHTTAGWLGAALGVAIGIPKEIGDGMHEGNGFSAPDMVFATGGAVLPALHRQWPATRALQVKFNYWPSDELRAPPAAPRVENDYAGQRYFLAIDPGLSPGGAGPWPDWLGVAIGHSVPHWISAPPVHQWYLTFDLNLRGAPIRAGWWHTLAAVLDQIHLPLPGIRIEDGTVALGLY